MLVVGVALALAALAPSVASAKQARLFAGTFGEATSTPVNPYPLSAAGSIAVDSSTHDLYITDPNNHRVEKFDSSGHFLFMLGLEVNKTAVAENATRKGEENVCPAAGHPADVCQAGRPGSTPGAFVEPVQLAVDNSSGASKGDLYVADIGAATGDEQALTVHAEEGTFTLEFEGEATAPIALNAPPASVEAALQALTKIGGAVHVSGSVGDYAIAFNHGGVSPRLHCNSSNLIAHRFAGDCIVTTREQVEKLDASGQPIATWGEAGELTAAGITDPPAPVAGPFRRIRGIAVDPSGNLWVSTAPLRGDLAEEIVYEFREDASFVTGWTGESGELAVDALDNLYFNGGVNILEFDSIGNQIGVVSPDSSEDQGSGYTFGVAGEALNAVTGDLYVEGQEGNSGIVKRYLLSTCHPVITSEVPQPGCEPAESFGAGVISVFGPSHPLAIDSATEALYVADGGHVAAFSFQTVPDVTTTKPQDPTATSATLTAVLNPGGVELNAGLEGCRFEWGETAGPYEHTAPCDKTAAQIGKATEPVEVDAPVTGLQPGKTYHYRLVASNANDVNSSITEPSFGADVAFGPPRLESESALDVTATSAELQTQVNPNDLDTHMRVEYGTEAGVYPQSAPVADIGSAGSVDATTFELSGLVPGTVYHYRVVAQNLLGEGPAAVIGPDHTFTTQTSSAFALLDNRGLELVSPPAKHGALIQGPEGLLPIQAAADGNAISYTSSSPTEPGAAGNPGDVQVLSTRSAAGWSSGDIATPRAVEQGAVGGSEYRVFSPDLSLGVVEPRGAFAPEISSEASEQTPYLRTDFSAADPAAPCTVACYRPLVTGQPGFANIPPGTKFGHTEDFNGVHFLDASPDARHIVLESEAPLEEGAPPYSLYEWAEGRLRLISILPGSGGPAASSSSGLPGRNTISTDGSRVVWEEVSNKHHLYLRDISAEQTLQLDLNKGGTRKGNVNPVFQSASPDGSVILFTDEQQLTADAGAAAVGHDLYRCEVITGEAGELECALTDLTPANGAESADMSGEILGASADGSSVYFVANGVLAHNQVDHGAGPEEAKPGDCGRSGSAEEELKETCNLYLSRDGATTFVASLSGADSHDWAPLSEQPTRVSPNGQWLALMSQRPLTGYDNRDRTSGEPVTEVYLYDASAGPAGTLRCASCDPSGARPHGVEYLQLERGANNSGAWDPRELVAASLAGANVVAKTLALYQDRYLSDSGRLFFNAVDALVSADTNGTEDVYEYEPSGVGTCTESTQTFIARSGGCVELISSGASNQESVFLDASESGDDVFFLTAAKLSPHDNDGAYDVYDARVDGGDREPERPIECQGDACQGFVEAPNDATPGSLTFSGPGNLKPLAPAPPPANKPRTKPKKCPKGKKLKRRKCVKAKKANTNKGHIRKPTSTRRAK